MSDGFSRGSQRRKKTITNRFTSSSYKKFWSADFKKLFGRRKRVGKIFRRRFTWIGRWRFVGESSLSERRCIKIWMSPGVFTEKTNKIRTWDEEDRDQHTDPGFIFWHGTSSYYKLNTIGENLSFREASPSPENEVMTICTSKGL